MKEPQNRLRAVPKLLSLAVALLTGLSFLGSFSVGDWTARPVRLYAGLTRGLNVPANEISSDSALWAQIQSVPRSAQVPTQVSLTDRIPETKVIKQAVPVEDFSADGRGLAPFFDALRGRDTLGRPVRIAFLGDSYVEGDILTSDLRERLQELYGGRGVGFVPLAPVDIWRNTLNVEHGGWNIRSSLHGSQQAPYLFNGQCFTPDSAGFFTAYTTVRTTGQREHAQAFNTAALLYTADSAATLYYKLGAAEEKEAELRPGGLRLYKTSRTGMRMAAFRVAADAGFTGYGLLLNDETGICVDNYSLRSSSGMQLLRMGVNRLAQLNRLVPCDLIVLQYGMNVMEPDRWDYQNYVGQMIRVVDRLREAMPGVPILIFGIGDRNFRNEYGEMVTMPGVTSFVQAQRQIARDTGAAFWNTYLAMGGAGSMRTFVESDPALANKDYTHINYAGGRRLGLAFAQALVDAQNRYE